jgi:hypothetical protein
MNEQGLQFHIEANDYFGTLATVLDLVSQDLARRGYKPHAGLFPVCAMNWCICNAPTGSKNAGPPDSVSAKSRRTRSLSASA